MAQQVNVAQTCRKCGKPLPLEEMHYYAAEDGTATCNDCEGEWMEDVAAWRRGEKAEFPAR